MSYCASFWTGAQKSSRGVDRKPAAGYNNNEENNWSKVFTKNWRTKTPDRWLCQGFSTAARSCGARLPPILLCMSVNEPLEDVIGYYTSQNRQKKTSYKLKQGTSPPFWLPSLGRGNDTIISYSVGNGRKMSYCASFWMREQKTNRSVDRKSPARYNNSERISWSKAFTKLANETPWQESAVRGFLLLRAVTGLDYLLFLFVCLSTSHLQM